jgi:hypothetical protein
MRFPLHGDYMVSIGVDPEWIGICELKREMQTFTIPVFLQLDQLPVPMYSCKSARNLSGSTLICHGLGNIKNPQSKKGKSNLPHHVQNVEDTLCFREDTIQDGVLVPGPSLHQS